MKRSFLIIATLAGLVVLHLHNQKSFFDSIRPLSEAAKEQSRHTVRVSMSPQLAQNMATTLRLDDSSSSMRMDLRALLERLSKRQYDVGTMDRKEEDLQLITKFQPDQWIQLARLLVDSNTSASNQRVASYLLSLAGPDAIPALVEVITSPFKANFSENIENTDLAYRLGALEKLDDLAVQNSEAQKLLREMDSGRVHRRLRFFLSISQMGLQQNTPGKLHKLMSAQFPEI